MKTEKIKNLTIDYIKAFNNKDIVSIEKLLKDNFVLEDPIVVRVEGREKALEVIKNIFDGSELLSFKSVNIFIDGNTSIIEFVLQLDGKTLKGTDIIEWENEKMLELRAYLDVN